MRKPLDALTEADCRSEALWKFTLDERAGEDETWVKPLRSKRLERPPTDLACVATTLHLADGSRLFGLISAPSGIREVDEQTTRISAFVDGERINLAGHYELGAENVITPDQFAAALSRMIEQVFPISYDVSELFGGNAEQWRGQVCQHPPRTLSEDELMDLIVRNLE